MYELLVSGYIRESEKALLKKLVPDGIKALCIKYYRSDSTVVLLRNEDGNDPYGICITEINGHQKATDNTVWNASIGRHFEKNGSLASLSRSMEISGLCCATNVPFPKSVIESAKLSGNHSANVIFKAGTNHSESSTGCFAVIINQQDLTTVHDKGKLHLYTAELIEHSSFI